MTPRPNALLTAPDRRGSDSNKWRRYPDDVLPLWVADMDFAADPAILAAVHARLAHPVLGYGRATDDHRAALVAAMARDYGWQIEADWLVFLPGVEPGFNMALRAFAAPGDRVLQELPVYKPLRAAPAFHGLELDGVAQILQEGRWVSDEAALAEKAKGARLHLLCNPQNPTGRVYTRAELERRAALCIEHDLVVISDEIHCGLVLDQRAHVPIATLSPQIARRTITLMAASKTWNIAGLKAAFAIIPDPEMRARFDAARMGMVDSVNVLGLAAMAAAYDCTDWRDAIRSHLAAMRDLVQAELARLIPKARLQPAEASFLAWIDFSALDLPQPAADFFLDHARVALSAGTDFGIGLEAWARINFGTTPDLLRDAIARMAASLAPAGSGA